jgi:hypothetical protein
MFKSIIPVLLMACTLVLSLWPTFTDDSTYATFGWALAGMVVLYAVTISIGRRNGSTQTVASVVEAAARVNAARVAPPTLNSCRHADGPQR